MKNNWDNIFRILKINLENTPDVDKKNINNIEFQLREQDLKDRKQESKQKEDIFKFSKIVTICLLSFIRFISIVHGVFNIWWKDKLPFSESFISMLCIRVVIPFITGTTCTIIGSLFAKK